MATAGRRVRGASERKRARGSRRLLRTLVPRAAAYYYVSSITRPSRLTGTSVPAYCCAYATTQEAVSWLL